MSYFPLRVPVCTGANLILWLGHLSDLPQRH